MTGSLANTSYLLNGQWEELSERPNEKAKSTFSVLRDQLSFSQPEVVSDSDRIQDDFELEKKKSNVPRPPQKRPKSANSHQRQSRILPNHTGEEQGPRIVYHALYAQQLQQQQQQMQQQPLEMTFVLCGNSITNRSIEIIDISCRISEKVRFLQR